MADARYTYTAGIPAARVGSLLARARTAGGIAEHDLASTLRVRLRTVRQWERGELVPSDDQIEAIAATCGIRLTELLPQRANLSYDSATGMMRLGDQTVALPTSSRDNDAVLGAFLGLVRRQRGLRADQDVSVRVEDLEALGEALHLDDEELEERFVRILGLSRRQAALVRSQLIRRRLTAGMVGLVAGLSLVAVNRVFTTATESVRTVGGGRTTRSNPYVSTTTTRPTVKTAATSAAVVSATAAPSSVPDSTTAAPAPGTLPAIVLAEQFVASVVPEGVRTGPARTTPRPDASRPGRPAPDTEPTTTATTENATAPTAPPTTTETTVPSSSTTPTTEVTTASPTSPATTTPTSTPTTGPVVSTVGGGGGTTGTTEPPATTTTTTAPPATTTTTEAPTTTTTTAPPPPTTPAPTTTTTTATPPPASPVVNNPNLLSNGG